MLVMRETATFDDIDWGMGQTTLPAGSIPIVQLGPVQLIAANLAPIGGLTAAVRTPSRVVNVIQVPNGIFQGSIDKTDFDQGATIIFSAPGYLPVQVPASQISCNTGARDVNGNVLMMTANPCTTSTFTLTFSMPAGSQSVSPYGQPYPYMPVVPPGYTAPYGYPPPPHQSSWDLPPPERVERPAPPRRKAIPASATAPVPVAPSVAPTIFESIPTPYLVGGGVILALVAGYFMFRG